MRVKRLIASMLLLAMMFSTGVVFAADPVTDGASMGYNDGYIFVLQNYTYGAEIPINPLIPSSSSITSKYSSHLVGKTEAYKRDFYPDYINGYLSGYNEGRAILIAPGSEQPVVDVDVNYADSLGTSLGEIYGYRDFYNNLNSNWSKAIPTNSKIISMFDLSRETSLYRNAFLTGFRESFKEAYEDAFEYGLLNGKDVIIGSAVTSGKEFGLLLGSIYGAKDYFESRTNNYKRNLPSDTSIINDYNLSKYVEEYKTGFLNAFKLGYEEGYNEAYNNSYKEAFDSGREAGRAKGQLMATQDYIENKTMSWSRHKTLDSAIRNEYRLIYLSNVNRDTFLNGFWTGFAESYEETYKALIGEQVNEKIAFTIIPISGGILASGDNSIAIQVESGTFYNDISLSIEKVYNDRYRIDESKYMGASDIYNIQLSNSSKNLDNSKPITIAMEYYGKGDGGIYKWVNGKWNYMPSTVEDGVITIEVNPNTLRAGDNIYRVLIDKNHTILTDIRGHWAKEEINTLVKRNIISGYPDKTYKPERNISRGEFLALLSRVYDWKLPSKTDNIQAFKDYQSFNSYDKLISYGIKEGYIIGYGDNTFRPSQPISYKEIELIMGRVLKDPNFRWYNTSASILYDKQIKSNSYNSMNNKITRSEVAYMLYILNEWRY